MYQATIRNKRLSLAILLLVLLTVVFWSGSRYPQLNEKALMGGDTPTSGIGFDAPWEVEASDTIPKKVLFNALNWAETNKKGMTFGVLFASIMILVFSLIDHDRISNRFGGSLVGMLLGAPLGVCTNCAAPIAKGIRDAGGQREIALATMTSSPTLNVVVIGMLFSLFPLYMALLKIGFSILFILLGIPLITYLFKDQNDVNLDCPVPKKSIFDHANVTIRSIHDHDAQWSVALKWIVKNFFISFWHIAKTTVPLMLLAGLLGSIFITLMPWGSFYGLFLEGEPLKVLSIMVLLALIGTFLPVPIAFDVIIVAILVSGGFPTPYAMVLLFTLGIYSIYSFFITKKAMNTKLAATVFAVVSGFGVLAGISSHYLRVLYDDATFEYYESLKDSDSGPLLVMYNPGEKKEFSIDSAKNEPIKRASEIVLSLDSIIISKEQLSQAQKSSVNSKMTTIQGTDVGLVTPYVYGTKNMTGPFTMGNALTSGDINQDGFVDVVHTNDGRMTVFFNQQGKFFTKGKFELFENDFVFCMALVDFNNDSWLDLFVSTYKDGNYLVLNDNGRFLSENLKKLPSIKGMVMTSAPSFVDVDRDGDLDIYLGNWSVGFNVKNVYKTPRVYHKDAKNGLLINSGGSFEIKYLEGIPGETLSTLVTDINQDGHIDIVDGNDFAVPDQYYFGGQAMHFDLIKRSRKLIPRTTRSTMSITMADINNDLKPEIFLNAHYGRKYRTNEPEEICNSILDQEHRSNCKKIFELQTLFHYIRHSNREFICPDSLLLDCAGIRLLYTRAEESPKNPLCEYYPEEWSDFMDVCKMVNTEHIMLMSAEEFEDGILQGPGTVVLEIQEDGSFKNKVTDYNLKDLGWSWNAKFMDLDHDEWQDLYVANGFLWIDKQPSNYLFMNKNGQQFEDMTNDYGLTNYLPSNAYSYIDFDNDGDMDILLASAIGPLFLYENTIASGNSMMFSINDEIGNYSGIGTRITIYYGPDGSKHQMREIMATGGFKSFDAPLVHFGLGEFDKIKRVKVHWSTGEKTIIEAELKSGNHYTLNRKSNQTVNL